MRDRIEEADRSFFERVAHGYHLLAASEPNRIRSINAAGKVEEIRAAIWKLAEPLVVRSAG
jgi:thymidylate kinase